MSRSSMLKVLMEKLEDNMHVTCYVMEVLRRAAVGDLILLGGKLGVLWCIAHRSASISIIVKDSFLVGVVCTMRTLAVVAVWDCWGVPMVVDGILFSMSNFNLLLLLFVWANCRVRWQWNNNAGSNFSGSILERFCDSCFYLRFPQNRGIQFFFQSFLVHLISAW